MRLPGYCTKCHKVANSVQVNSTGMAMMARGGVPSGICTACTLREDEDRKLTRHGYQPQRLTPRERTNALREINRRR